jgi:DNA-3-methyladenine glycosylase II
MFLMFRLGRPNVLPDLDLGIQNGMQRAYGLRKRPKPKDVLEIGKLWAPFASVGAWYMWRVLELSAWDAARRKTPSRKRTAGKKAARRKA